MEGTRERRGGEGEGRGGKGVLGIVVEVGIQIARMGQEKRRENVQMEGPKLYSRWERSLYVLVTATSLAHT